MCIKVGSKKKYPKIPVFTGVISVMIYMNCSQRKINKRFNVPFTGCYVAHSGKKFMENKICFVMEHAINRQIFHILFQIIYAEACKRLWQQGQ